MKRLLALCLVFVVFSPAWSFADQKLMSLEEVQRLVDSNSNKSVNAHFDTVLRGTKIESLDIVVKGIHKEPGLEIIIFTSKRQIAAGMSGSPVYVNSKLIGAVAYSINNYPNEYWGGISPISLMINDANGGLSKLGKSFVYEGKLFTPISLGLETISELGELANQRFIRMTNSGGSGSKSSGLNVSDIKPGMPIVVDLAEWTDETGKTSTLGASGTVTHVDGTTGKVFAFGHPFMNSKEVVYGFRIAEIIGTIPSNGPAPAVKLIGQSSDVLGAITHDSSYGIYGKIGAKEELKRLRHFSLEFKNKGVPTHKFDIKVAESVMTPTLVSAAFALIGQNYGAPLSQEVSVSQIESRIDIEGHQPILWKGLYPSSSFRFGPQILYRSSFYSASDAFLTNIYVLLLSNNYGLKISDVSVSVNFIPGASQTYKIGGYKFPNKVIYGQDPVLDVMFVDEHNVLPVAKRVTVKIDWGKIEKPIYTLKTNDKDKVSEKIVGGWLGIQSSKFYTLSLSNEESQKIFPKYFLNQDDFLENLSMYLGLTNQKIFVRTGLRSRSGLFDETMAKSENIMPTDIVADENGWHIIDGGLNKRSITLKNEGVVIFYLNLPEAPNGYVFDQGINESILFEVVLEK